MFGGSLRSNLDPFDRYTDDELWKALDMAHLRVFVCGLPQHLDYDCGEGGDSLRLEYLIFINFNVY